jgi:hypothetical protein
MLLRGKEMEKKKLSVSWTIDEEVVEALGKYATARERSISWCVNNFMKEKFRLGQYDTKTN